MHVFGAISRAFTMSYSFLRAIFYDLTLSNTYKTLKNASNKNILDFGKLLLRNMLANHSFHCILQAGCSV